MCLIATLPCYSPVGSSSGGVSPYAGQKEKDANLDLASRLRLPRNPAIPCVLLEGEYMSHHSEACQISDSAHRDRLAKAIAGAIRRGRKVQSAQAFFIIATSTPS